MRNYIRSLDRVFLVLLILYWGLISCSKNLQQSTTAPNPLPVGVAAQDRIEPAPVGYTKAEATRYYNAQLEMMKLQAGPRKLKNSNNTTIEQHQTVQTTNIWHLVLAAVAGFVAGILMTLAVIVARRDVRALKLDPR